MLEITSLSQFNNLKTSSLLIIDFYATWCGPCKAISPAFSRLATQYASSPSLIFAQVDVDKAKDVAQTCGISAMPTFQFFRHGKKVDEVKGADVQQLTTKIGFYTKEVEKEGPQAGSAGASNSKTTNGGTTSSGSLRSLIDLKASRLLGASNLSSIKNIASPPPAGYSAASASGARLLIHLVFTQSVSPSAIKVKIVKNGLSNAPSRIQMGSNVPVKVVTSSEGVESNDLEMDSLVKAENTQAFNVFSDEYGDGVAELKLKSSKFTGVKSLTIRVDANLSGDENVVTKIGEMDIVGSKA